MTNKSLGKYELLEPLGSGATADVFLARDTVLDREVALKVLKPALVVDGDAFARFTQEARFAAKLFHDAIATVLDMGEAEGRYFIAMQYIPGRSLDKILKEDGPFPWEEVVRLARQIGEALDFAHSQGFLHRDVKPSNIIRTPEGNFVLTDFGLTRAMMSTGLTSHTGAVLGTPSYIAPEVWEGKEASPATDQYALACVVAESLTGEVLFAGNTPPAIMTRHMLKGAELPEKWPRGVPPGISGVLGKALSRQPEERFGQMLTFIQSLEGVEQEDEKRKEEKTQPETEETDQREAEKSARRASEEKAHLEAEERARQEAEAKARQEVEEQARREADERVHKRQHFWQILMPILLVIVLILVAGGVIIGAEASQTRLWTDIATIWLVTLLMLIGLLCIAVLGGMIYAVARMTRMRPHNPKIYEKTLKA